METGVSNAGFVKDGPDTANSLSVDNALNCNLHTYIHEPNQSLSKYTIEALPVAENYRKLSKIHIDQRPTVEELMAGEKVEKAEEPVTSQVEVAKGKVVKFGWIEGVYMRCLLAIWGVMLFLRLTWVMGQAGLIEGLVILTLCNLVTGITALSMSAVATNGQIASGGVYYMISRALGPEFGGAIGILFTVANSVSVAVTTLGFVDSLLDLIYDVSDFEGIVASNEDRYNDLRLIGTPVLVLILILAIIGMDWVTRVQKLLLVLLIVAQVDMIVGTFIRGGSAYVDNEVRHAKGFTSWSLETVKKNIYSDYLIFDGKQESFISVFGVFFSSVTGIVAGANLSGDLKDPASAIPKGTLAGILTTYVSYMFFGVMISFNFLRQASGNIEELDGTNSDLPAIDDCTAAANMIRASNNLTYTSCDFGSSMDQRVMTLISGTGYLVYLGCYGATLSSAIASLVGAPRVLQAVGKDKLYPKLEFFAKGHGANNDPFRGYILVFFIAFGCLMIAELNVIGKLSSNFFLAAYALMNLSVFHSSMTKSPGWRPSFKFYNPWISLLGSIICIALMIIIEWKLGCATLVAITILYGLTLYLKPEANWGSSAEALVFVNTLNNSYTLNEQADHVKNYRPKILLLSGNPAHRQPLVDFANLITKKMSLLICAQVVKINEIRDIALHQKAMEGWLKVHNIRAFYTVTVNENMSEGVQNMISLSGLGKLRPNMVMMGYCSNKSDLESITHHHTILSSVFENNMAVGILRLPNGTDYSQYIAKEETKMEEDNDPKAKKKRDSKKSDPSVTVYRDAEGKPLQKSIVDSIQQFHSAKKQGFIDVWWLYDDGGLTILLPYILQTRKQFADCKLRVFSLSSRPDSFDPETRNLASLLAKFRIDFSEVNIISDITKKANPETKAEFQKLIQEYPEGSITKADINANIERTNRHLRTAELLRENSMSSELVVFTLPLPRKGQCVTLYMAWLEMITKGLPPVLLTRGNQTSVLTYYS